MNEITARIHELARRVKRDVTFMEVCGTHTMAVSRSGLRDLLPVNVKLISGPGCPVCVTDTNYIDAAIELARRPGVIMTTFGDLVRVPGSETSLEQERAKGADVRIVYSPSDALALARENTARQVVFLGVGFETTAPTVASCIKKAAQEGLKNFTVLCAHKTMPHAMEALLKDKEVKIDGFICPGHVSVITGSAMYRFIPERYGIPCVVCGFEAGDVMKCIAMLLVQIAENRAAVEIEYTRSVNETGNAAAQQLMAEIFEESDAGWRGIGVIPGSGLSVRTEFTRWDAAKAFGVKFGDAKPHPGCRCGDVLRGVMRPMQCKLFAKVCTPLNPMGPCMVSSEGACAAAFKYERKAVAA
jgi:hydrogenase expression/formation protein HypD